MSAYTVLIYGFVCDRCKVAEEIQRGDAMDPAARRVVREAKDALKLLRGTFGWKVTNEGIHLCKECRGVKMDEGDDE